MEENKKKEGSNELTQEQLKAYANQVMAQANKAIEENNFLKKKINELMYGAGLKETELAIQCLKYKDLFSEKFIKAITNRIEYVLTPEAEESKKEITKKETKEE